jgi:hypothetical protein
MKTQLKRSTVGLRVPPSPVPSVRNATIPDQYVDPARLGEALQILNAARVALLAACDQADLAAQRAGSPLRTQTVRVRIESLTNEVRAIELRIAQAASGELAQGRGLAGGVGKTLAARRPNEIDREFDPRDRSRNIDSIQRAERDLMWDFLHRSLRDPRWYRVARRTNQTGSIDPNLLAQYTKKDGTKPTKQSKPSDVAGPPIPLTVEAALKKVRALLKDGGWGTDRLTNGELKALVELFRNLGYAAINSVIAQLTDAELKRIADDMDSSGIGNYDGLSSSEKEAFISNLARALDAKQFARVAVAFDDPEQFAKILSKTKEGWPAKQGFLTYCGENFAKLQPHLRDNLVGNVWSNSSALLLATLPVDDLLNSLFGLKGSPEFLQSIFKAAAGLQSHQNSSGLTEFWFEPNLLLKINEIALQFPESAEAMRFLVFQQTIEALASAKKQSTSTIDDAGLKRVLLATTNLLDPHPLAHLKIHSAAQDTYEEWMVQLLRSGRYDLVQNLTINVGRPSEGGDLWWTGYVLAIVQRAANRIDRDSSAQADFVVNVIGGLLNSLPSLGQVAASVMLELTNKARQDAETGKNIGDVLMHALKLALEGESHRQDRKLLGDGYADGIDSKGATR